MKAEDWALLTENFERLVSLEGDSLAKALSEVCDGNSELADEIRRLLAAQKVAGEFLSESAIVPAKILTMPPLFQPGEIVAGRFRVTRFIAEGGIGQVYEAEDLVLEEKIALKAISSPAGKESAWALLKQEIQSARRVTHPYVCRIHDVVEHGGLMLMTMELLEGPTLSQYLREHGPMPRRTALQVIQQMAAGLQSAHDSGVIHRDFKPGNVMLLETPTGLSAKITDFGLASPIGSTHQQSALRAGTPGYMAPEQAAGCQLTPATDVYALGVVIREMVGAGGPPKSLPTPAIQPVPMNGGPKLLGPWKRVVERCLAEDPAKRYQQPADVTLVLQRIQRRRWQIPVFAACGVLLIFSITFYWQRSAGSAGSVIRSVADATDKYVAYSVSPM